MAKKGELDAVQLAFVAFMFRREIDPLREVIEEVIARYALLDSPPWRAGVTRDYAVKAWRDWSGAEFLLRAALQAAYGHSACRARGDFDIPSSFESMGLRQLADAVRRSWPGQDQPDWAEVAKLVELAESAGRSAEKMILRFPAVDVMANRDAVILGKERTKARLGFPSRVPPPPPRSGPRDYAAYECVRRLASQGHPAKAIAKATGVPLRTIYRWIR